MNFVDSALTLLKEADGPMAVDELCRRAIERGLLDKPGANPLRSMKARLTFELKKGTDSRVVKTDEDVWCLRETLPGDAIATENPSAPPKGASAKKKKAKSTASKKNATEKKETSKSAASAEKVPRGKAKKNGLGQATQVSDVEATVEERAATEVVLGETVPLSPEEQALVDLYSQEPVDTTPMAALNEYSDAHTKDEDRPMLPEIRAERHHRQRERRSRRNRESKNRISHQARTRPVDAPAKPVDIAGAPIEVVEAQGLALDSVTKGALAILRELPLGQTMPVRQLTQAMIRKNLLQGNADTQWRMVKGALLVSEQSRKARGFVALIRYHGRDLFSAAPESGRSVVDVAAQALARAAESYAQALETEILRRLANLSPGMLERFAYVFLERTGWSDIQWIKRVERSSYAIARASNAADATLISVCVGKKELDRRSVGELRAGLYAKSLNNGFLLSPLEMSDEARTELAKEGGHVRVLCGVDFAREIACREVGLTTRSILVPQIDQRFLDAILS